MGVLDVGGAEKVTLDLSRYFFQLGVSSVVVCAGGRRGALSAEYERYGVDVYVTDLKANVLKALLQYGEIVIRRSPTAVVAHVSLFSSFYLVMAKLLGVKTRVARLHSDGDGRAPTLYRRILRSVLGRLLSWASTEVCAVSPGALEFYRRYSGSGKGCILVNGVNCGVFRHVPGPREGVVYIGRSDPAKNRARLLGISRSLHARRLGRITTAGGDGTDIDFSAHPDLFVPLGVTQEIPSLLSRASALLLVSTREGLPGVILEALASGVPVVSSRTSGSTYIAERVPGLTIVDLDSPDEVWADALQFACEVTEVDRAAIAKGLSESEFNLAVVADTWADLLGLST
ncbi:glycosyltransferase [Dietzia maris]|uniref:glycosyltransferase family 4 protein n=1 Tax=Dietzia maris TaxID=37915 RepID=UPI0036F33266